MGYTLLGSLTELLFTQFFHFCFAVHLPASEQSVFLFFDRFCLGEKGEWFFLLLFCFCWEKAEVLLQYFYTKFYLCHEHFRFCATST